MQGSAWLFFLLFASVLVVIYLAIRREWAGPGVVSVVGVIASIIAMVLMSLAQGNSVIQAVVVGVVVGFIFSGATLAIAWYFHSNELRARYINRQMYAPSEEMPAENQEEPI